MSPPSHARSSTRRRMGSGSPPGSASPPPWSMGVRRRVLNPSLRAPRRRPRERDQAGEPAGHRGLRHGRIGPRGQLPERQRGVAKPELGSGSRAGREGVERTPRRAAPGQRRAARGPRCSAVRDWHGRRSPAGSHRLGDRRRARAPRASSTVSVAPGDGEDRPRSRPSSSHRRPSANRGRRPASARRPPSATLRTNAAPAWSGVRTSRCGERGPLSEPRAEEGATKVGRRGSRGARRRGPGAGRGARCSLDEHAGFGEDLDRVRRAGDAGAACEPRGRRRDADTCGSRSRREEREGSRTPAARPTTPRDRGGTRARRARGGAPPRRCGRARRFPRGDRTGARGRPRRAPRARRRRASSSSQQRSLEREQPPLEARSRRSVPAERERLLGPAATTRWQGTTSDRAVRGAEAPCRSRRARAAGAARRARRR